MPSHALVPVPAYNVTAIKATPAGYCGVAPQVSAALPCATSEGLEGNTRLRWHRHLSPQASEPELASKSVYSGPIGSGPCNCVQGTSCERGSHVHHPFIKSTPISLLTAADCLWGGSFLLLV
jgi:hypothetical protein